MSPTISFRAVNVLILSRGVSRLHQPDFNSFCQLALILKYLFSYNDTNRICSSITP